LRADAGLDPGEAIESMIRERFSGLLRRHAKATELIARVISATVTH